MTGVLVPSRQEFRERGPVWEAGWTAGCRAEAAVRDEGLSGAARGVRDLLESFARMPRYRDASKADLVALLLHIEGAVLPRWRRLLVALKAAW